VYVQALLQLLPHCQIKITQKNGLKLAYPSAVVASTAVVLSIGAAKAMALVSHQHFAYLERGDL
jgi:hypothetical protein